MQFSNMTTLQRSVLSLFGVFAILGALAFFNITPFRDEVMQLAGASPIGTTFNTAKIAQVSVAPAAPGTNATSTSILNTDVNDRYITSEEGGCENLGTSKTAYTGTGLAALTVSMATSSTAAPASNANPNVVGSIAMTIGTSTVNFVIASSTASNGTTPGSALVSNIWTAGSYLTLTFNATNTAACVIGVRYLAS